MHSPDSAQPPRLRHRLRPLISQESWKQRAVLWGGAVAVALVSIVFAKASDAAFHVFQRITAHSPWWALLLTPSVFALLAWLTNGALRPTRGSGIPQVIAALERPDDGFRQANLSLRVSAGKLMLTTMALFGGASIGREGPTVHVGASLMYVFGRWFGFRDARQASHFLLAGGAAGIAAAFNTPLAGVVFAIEELSRKFESRSSGLIIAAIVLAGLMGVSVFGNLSYFGRILVTRLGWDALLPGLAVSLFCGVLGGLFAKLLADSLTGAPNRFNRWRARWPVRFAAGAGLAVAVIGLVTGGATFGAGSEAVKHMLAGEADVPHFYVTLKFIATWLTAWAGVPGGIFAPSLSIGAGVGHNVAVLMGGGDIAPALIAMGMAAFLAAVTQAPLTSFIIVMEMVDGQALVLSLMSAAMLASLVSRMLARPLYETLAEAMLSAAQLPAAQAEPEQDAAPGREEEETAESAERAAGR